MFHYHKFTGICELKVAAIGQSSNDSNVLTGPPSCFGNVSIKDKKSVKLS
jgi:hypothetical protein